jgi:hypothetical protein
MCNFNAATVVPVLTLLTALTAVGIASRQLSLNRKNQRETTAKATFREFLKMCVQNPDLANGKPNPFLIKNDAGT